MTALVVLWLSAVMVWFPILVMGTLALRAGVEVWRAYVSHWSINDRLPLQPAPWGPGIDYRELWLYRLLNGEPDSVTPWQGIERRGRPDGSLVTMRTPVRQKGKGV